MSAYPLLLGVAFRFLQAVEVWSALAVPRVGSKTYLPGSRILMRLSPELRKTLNPTPPGGHSPTVIYWLVHSSKQILGLCSRSYVIISPSA